MSLLSKVLIAQNHTLDTYANLSSGTKDLSFGLGLHLLFYFVCVSNLCSDKTAATQLRLSRHWLPLPKVP